MTLVLFLGGFLLVAIGGHIIGFTYFLNLWYAFDCFCNAVLGGDPRETMSSRLGKAVRRGNRFAIVICRILHLGDKDHCAHAIEEKLGERGVPAGMVAVGIIFILTVALAVFGCGPDRNMVGVGLSDDLSGRVVDQFSGEPVASVRVTYRRASDITDANGRFRVVGIEGGSRVQFRGAAILNRSTYAADGDSMWKVVPADFDTAAFNDLSRAYSSSGTVRWGRSPRIYIDTRRHCFTGGDPQTWAAESKVQAEQFVGDWTAGMAHPTITVTDNPPEDHTLGTIVFHMSECTEHLGQFIGFVTMYWGRDNKITSATIHARFKKYASSPGKRKGILGHELGHTLGYRHLELRPSFMAPSLGSKTGLLAFDHLAAALHYGRVPKNRHLDIDGRGDTDLGLAAGGYWQGW